MKNLVPAFAAAVLLSVPVLLAGPAMADPALDSQILGLARGWDHAKYEVRGKDAQLAEMQRLEGQAAALSRRYPGKAEPLVWDAILLSSEGGLKGGLDGLGLAKQAKLKLEKAEAIDPRALGDGSVYTSLGSLYYQVPGFPIGFGDKTKARAYLNKAVAANPTGVDANYFLGDFLLQQGDYAGAAKALQRAVQAPARPGREVADRGRRAEAAALLAQARRKL